jgi:hypothetical protein
LSEGIRAKKQAEGPLKASEINRPEDFIRINSNQSHSAGVILAMIVAFHGTYTSK